MNSCSYQNNKDKSTSFKLKLAINIEIKIFSEFKYKNFS